MNGHTLRLVLVGTVLLSLTGCSSPAPEDKAKPKPELDLTITFTDNPKGGPCMGTIDKDKGQGTRNEWVYVQLLNQGCSTWNADNVTLAFDDNVMKTRTLRRVNGTEIIVGHISADRSDAPDGRHTYSIQYGESKAADPEIDVNGDCCIIVKD